MTIKVNLMIVSYRDQTLSHRLFSENHISTLTANPSIYSIRKRPNPKVILFTEKYFTGDNWLISPG